MILLLKHVRQVIGMNTHGGGNIGGAGGFLASILGLKTTGIPGTLLYLNNQLPYYILTNVVAMAVAFALTYTIGYKEEAETAPASKGSGSPAPAPLRAVWHQMRAWHGLCSCFRRRHSLRTDF